jgi:hypothetical protein
MSAFETHNNFIAYRKTSLLDLNELKTKFKPDSYDKDKNYNPFNVSCIQNYQPIHSLFFNMTQSNYNNFQLNHFYHFRDFETVVDSSNQIVHKNTYIKYSPLVDPVRYLIGKYKNNDDLIHLPKLMDNNTNTENILNNTDNASYIDGFFSFLCGHTLHNYNFINSIDYYGSFLSVQDKFKCNITDDYDYLNDSKFFNNNINKIFHLSLVNDNDCNVRTRNKRSKLVINNDNDNIYNINLDYESVDNTFQDSSINYISDIIEPVYENNNKETCSSDDDSNDDDSNDDDSNDDDSNDDDSNDDDSNDDDSNDIDNEIDDEEEEEEDDDGWESDSSLDSIDEQVYAYIHNFPVQMICLEKCEGTLDSLFENNEINEDNGCSALMQVIMSLLTYQKMFHFTHNDLHTNNIMYSNTSEEYIYYKFNDIYYKVPTYGKIFKIIDFGRSIYKFKGQLFCSCSFYPGGDAATQYNFGPFYNKKRPIIEPNYSFDLCRLGTSIYDFIIDDISINNMDELQKTIYRWCLDDNSKNILYKKNGDERFPEFKLYKMIARTVHHHTPQNQLKEPYFNKYSIKDIIPNIKVIDIDSIPCYA